MFGLNFSEVLIVGIVAIMLFGKRLPEVAKSLGHTYREFRKGISEFHAVLDTTETYVKSPPKMSYRSYDDYEPVTAPKFEPPTSEPVPASQVTSAPTSEASGS